ncbi:MAG: NADP-dependent oxidoreductase [Flammeovirgaceae bacterium]|nr:NADP-dependent oxidoreductase [Flammeovirgaceae bacterium]
MAQEKNKKIIFNKRPVGVPDEDCFKFLETDIPEISEGQVLVEIHYLSVDPYMRGRMNDRKSYIAPFQVGEVFTGGAVGKIKASKDKKLKEGDFVVGMMSWENYAVVPAKELTKISPELAPISTSLGVLGMPGLTAYFGLLEIGKPKDGETVVVSGAAGAVGTIVGQIAKMKGCRVVGIAGSDEKINYLKNNLGFDEGINYKTTKNLRADLKAACPKGVDVYFENVGGEISDTVITLLNNHARIPLCGQIADYNVTEMPMGPRWQSYLLTRMALLQGFIVGQFSDKYGEGLKQLATWLKEGKLKYKENILEGIESTPDAFLGLFKGENIGKQLVKLK